MALSPTEYQQKTRKVLVAPLDWGLGHATRCIPLVKELIKQNCDVWLAGEGDQLRLLQTEFPDLKVLPLRGYRVRYAKTRLGLWINMISQSPGLFWTIHKENRWLKKQVKTHRFDAVISDNRFGLSNSKIPSVFLTHQLQIKSSIGSAVDALLRKLNYRYINRFRECWVVDQDKEPTLAGELAHPSVKPRTPLRYIGLLSRFEEHGGEETAKHLTVILSGPEPQRTLLEDKIIDQLSHYNGTATVVRGLPSAESIIPSTNMIKFYNHLSAADLNNDVERAEYVISRSGYSTVMDLVRLNKKSILIPTPGQTEQEYLAKYLQQKQIALSIEQKDFSLEPALAKAKKFNYHIPSFARDTLAGVVKSFLDKL